MKTRLFSLWLLLSVAVGLSAYDFKVDGLCYNITDRNLQTVEVTYESKQSPNENQPAYKRLTTVIIPESVTYADRTFSVTSIGSYAFYGCTGLTSVTIPNSVTSIGSGAFYGCTGLTKVNYIGDIKGWLAIDMKSNPISYSRNLYINHELLTDLIIPDGMTYISSNFGGCASLTSVTIPNSVTSIGSYAFYGCTGLTSITIPNSVTGIARYAFSGCTGLTSVTIPNSVIRIGDFAFADCTGITSVTIGSSVTNISYNVFKNCKSLTSVIWNAKVYNDYESAYGTLFYNSSCDIRPQITSFVFGDSVQHIPDCLCAGMKNLASITIGNNVTSIGVNTFNNCIGLTSVVWNAKNCNDFSKRYTPFYGNWPYQEFDLRPQITSFVFGDSVQHIPNYLCTGMKNVASIIIPNSVTSIGINAFLDCTGLTKVNYRGDVKGWMAIDMESNPISYSYNLYINNEFLTDLIIPEGITYISSNFGGCASLTSITIPNSVTSIGNNAFSGCKNVETVVFGSAVETIGASAFSGCQSIYEMTIYATKVPTIQENTFAGVGTGATLRVPAGCVPKYKAHPYWGVFNIEEIPSEYTITVTCDPKQGQVTGSGTYTEGSEVTITAIPYKGYEFVRWSDGNTANPYSFLAEKSVTIEALFEPTTPIENVAADNADTPNKIIRDGQVLILRDGKTYTPMGAEVNE